MRVIATAVGYDGRTVRQPGDEFDMPDGAKGSWFTPKEPPAEAAAPKAQRAPKAAKAEAPKDGNTPAEDGALA